MMRLIMLFIISACVFACTKKSADDVQPSTVYTTGNNGNSCDTNNVSFSATVMPIINANCSGCHGNPSSSGISLTNHGEVAVAANNGSLYGAISHSPGFSPMPKGGGMLPACDISKVKSWVNAGTPNN